MTDRSTERRPSRPSTTPGPEDTAPRPALTERITQRLSRAADEHQANKKQGDTQQAGSTTGSSTKKGSKAGGTTAGGASAQPGPGGAAGAGRTPRRARLRLTRVDPWSVMKTAFLLSIAFAIVTVVSVLMVWTVLDRAGVWESINQTVTDIVGQESASDFDVENYIGTSRVLGFTMLVAAVDVILLTAVATLSAFLYNMSAALLGGIEVTLAEDN